MLRFETAGESHGEYLIATLTGLPAGVPIQGAAVALMIRNQDWQNWSEALPVEAGPESEAKKKPLTRPRPGHADLAGAIKYDFHDARPILERASARETTARVAAGAVA